jgi:hypothetical protein
LFVLLYNRGWTTSARCERLRAAVVSDPPSNRRVIAGRHEADAASEITVIGQPTSDEHAKGNGLPWRAQTLDATDFAAALKQRRVASERRATKTAHSAARARGARRANAPAKDERVVAGEHVSGGTKLESWLS